LSFLRKSFQFSSINRQLSIQNRIKISPNFFNQVINPIKRITHRNKFIKRRDLLRYSALSTLGLQFLPFSGLKAAPWLRASENMPLLWVLRELFSMKRIEFATFKKQ
jgi:hypothetical protein